MTDKKINDVHDQPDHLWTDSKVIRELHETVSILQKDIKSSLKKQAHW